MLLAHTSGCADNDHVFDKFDDTSLFCRRCGEHRVLGEPEAPATLEAILEAIARMPHQCGCYHPVIYQPCTRPHYYQTGDFWYRSISGTTTTVASPTITTWTTNANNYPASSATFEVE